MRVPHLASHVLELIARLIRSDWQEKYGHPVHALETFVERSRFRGTCYRAADWQRLGETRGRTRHSCMDAGGVPFNLDEESDGTLRFIDFSIAFHVLALKNSGHVFIVDELDR